MTFREGGRSQGRNCRIFRASCEQNTKRCKQNEIHHHDDNPTLNAFFRKDYTTVVRKLLSINAFLDDSFIKVGKGIRYSEEVCAFVDSIPKVDQQQSKEFIDTRLIRCK